MLESSNSNQDFGGVIKKIDASLCRAPTIHLLYVIGKGFIVQKDISKLNASKLKKKIAYLVGFYGIGVEDQWIRDDCKEFLDGVVL